MNDIFQSIGRLGQASQCIDQRPANLRPVSLYFIQHYSIKTAESDEMRSILLKALLLYVFAEAHFDRFLRTSVLFSLKCWIFDWRQQQQQLLPLLPKQDPSWLSLSWPKRTMLAELEEAVAVNISIWHQPNHLISAEQFPLEPLDIVFALN